MQRLSERSVFRLLIGDRVHLRQHLLHQVSGRLAMVIHADRHVVGDLLKGERHLLQTSDVIVVILNRVEGESRNKLGKRDLQAIELGDWHFPGLEPGFLLVPDQLAYQQVFAQLLLGATFRPYPLPPIE